ncbi:hypothetical protein G3N95_30205 [Paraburkholderia sp. Tr-20389]|uniref:hypothetical protein n=1 Tax=Paraburkholderia sp. Tr-20389 TaxID=2703903 RepID=UPI00197F2809|nr:hypothetical protein [Paraburkholderia sp. Tr-20389]MBN3757249.1 hypothetical protein [Paraburkholderia sp. Tr-20389]
MADRNPTPIGEKFNLLTIVGEPEYIPGRPRRVTVQCDCGTIKDVPLRDIKTGNTKSCGCLKFAPAIFNQTHGHAKRGAHSREYDIWISMKSRCTRPTSQRWEQYGGRGIRVCERWMTSFEAFFEDMGKCPDGLSLDREDVNGNYEPGNCRWADDETQRNNRRNNRVIEYQGESMTLAQWSRKLGLNENIIEKRLKRNWPIDRAFSQPARPPRYKRT